MGIAAAIAIAVLALLVAGIALEDAESQAAATRDRVDVMAGHLDTMQANQRPWISAEIGIASDLTFDDKGIHLRLRYTLANSGRSPAFNVVPVATLLTDSTNPAPAFDPSRELEDRCGNIVRLVSRASQSGAFMPWNHAIFPGTRLTVEEPADLPHSTSASTTGPVLVVSCVDYRSGQVTDHHQTGDVFFLRRISPDKPGTAADIDLNVRERVPAAELSLSPATLGTYAN